MNYFKLILFCAILVVTSGFAQSNIMTFNIRYSTPNDGENWWELRKEEVVESLKYYHPDFIGIQEAMPSQLNFIAQNLDAYSYIGHGRDGLNSESEAIPLFYNTAKYELIDNKVFWLSETPEEVSRGWDAALNRIAVHGVFKSKITNQTIDIINTHFDHEGEIARLMSAELLIEYIKENGLLQKRIILLGDFNSLPTESPIKVIESQLSSSYSTKDCHVYGPFGTFNGFNTIETVTKKIDYIFTKNITIKKYRCIDDRRKNNLYLSDHFPILIEI